MRRFILVLFIIAQISSFAADFSDGKILYTITSVSTVKIARCAGAEGKIALPPYVTYHDWTYKVTEIGPGAFYGCSELLSVIIPNGVTRISDNAFGGCSRLTSVEIPQSVTSISYSAFSGCYRLRIPKHVIDRIRAKQANFEGLADVAIYVPQNTAPSHRVANQQQSGAAKPQADASSTSARQPTASPKPVASARPDGANAGNVKYVAEAGSAENANDETSAVETIEDEDKVYDIMAIEQKPEFPGGDVAMYKWIAENIVYPEDAKAKNVQGRVVVSFIVGKDGSISNVHIVHTRHPSLDAEAECLVRAMPKWTPGYNNGKPRNVSCVIPVTFRL